MYASSSMPFHTISTRTLMSSQVVDTITEEVPYCLDGGDGVEGTVVTISPCLPSPDPEFNRADSQHFFYSIEGLIKFYQNGTTEEDWLCVTNQNPDGSDGSTVLLLSECRHSAQQTWGYNGYAPGNGGDGVFSYGVHMLGIVGSTSGGNDSDSKDNSLFSDDNVIIWSVAGGAFLFVLIAVVAVVFVRRGAKDSVTLVYRNGKSVDASSAPNGRASSVSMAPRPSSVHNQQGSREETDSTTEMSGSLTKDLERSDDVVMSGANQA